MASSNYVNSWYFIAVFHKVQSADLFWFAWVSNLVREKKKLLWILFIKSQLIIKFDNFTIQSFIFILFIIWSAKFVFNVLWYASKKSWKTLLYRFFPPKEFGQLKILTNLIKMSQKITPRPHLNKMGSLKSLVQDFTPSSRLGCYFAKLR
jgi:hypothetical protein